LPDDRFFSKLSSSSILSLAHSRLGSRLLIVVEPGHYQPTVLADTASEAIEGGFAAVTNKETTTVIVS
jgi:hypothetical protein